MKKKVLILLALFIAQVGMTQIPPNVFAGQNFVKALKLLHHDKKVLTTDSALFNNEITRLQAAYYSKSMVLQREATTHEYATFATGRYIGLSSLASEIGNKLSYYDSLFIMAASYPEYVEYDSLMASEIAKAVVYGLEISGPTDKDSLLNIVTGAMKKHYIMVEADQWPLVRQQAFVDRYASQYYNRGIISMAESVFRAFEWLYRGDSINTGSGFIFSQNYPLVDANLIAENKVLSDLDGQQLILNPRTQSNMDLIYLITLLRTASESNLEEPIVLVCNPYKIDRAYLNALQRNLSYAVYHVVFLDESDTSFFAHAPQFGLLRPDGSTTNVTNSPIEFLEWLETPLLEKRAAAKVSQQVLQKENEERMLAMSKIPVDTTLKQELFAGGSTIRLFGYWPNNTNVKTKRYRFTQSGYNYLPEIPEVATIEIYQNDYLIYALDYMPYPGCDNIDLISNQKHDVVVKFENHENQLMYKQLTRLDSLTMLTRNYNQLIEKYPYRNSKFVKSIRQRKKEVQTQISNQLLECNSVVQAVFSVKFFLSDMRELVLSAQIKHTEISQLLNSITFDSILWNSPYYKSWIDACLLYGQNDLKSTIDMLLGSSKWIPPQGESEVGRYIWKQMNAFGREDMMFYIDSTYLSNCRGNNLNVKKRLSGYKRMAIGKKAPDITWYENGQEMHLDQILADTVLVVFWADWCGHCQEYLPTLYSELEHNKTTKVIAVNIDEDESSQEFGKQLMPRWIHIRAPKKWQDPIVEQYNVFATPSIFILDASKHVLGRLK